MSTGMIPDEYIALIRNKEAVDVCAPLLYITIIDWSCTKPQDETFEDYIENNAFLDKCSVFSKDKAKKDWKKKHFNKLKVKDLNGFDVTFLHELRKIICYEKITDQVTSLLQEVKDLRNDVSHEANKAKDPKHFNELRNCISNCLTIAGPLFGKDFSEIDNIKKEIDRKFNKILEETNQNYDTRIKYINTLITNECINEFRHNYCNKYNSVSLPGINKNDIERCKIFHNVMLSWKNNENENITIKCTELFDKMNSEFIVINGISGSGKTTLMKTMLHDILKVEDSTKNFKGIAKYLLPLFIECRMKTCEHLGELVKRTYPTYLSTFCEKEVLDAIQLIDGLIILIDGYDEVNESSEKLFDEAILFCKNKNVTCIISGRLHAAKVAEDNLSKYDIKFKSVSIEKIIKLEDQVDLLKRYEKALQNCDKLVEKFEQMSEVTRGVFNSPILLALFCSLFIENIYLNSSINNLFQIYEAFYELFRKQIEQKLRGEKCRNPRNVSEQMMEELSKLSLKLYNERQYIFAKKNFDAFIEDCKRVCNVDFDYEDLFACVLSPEHSMMFNKVLSYQFPHTSIHEYFAARCIMQYSPYEDSSIEVTASQMIDFLGLKGMKRGLEFYQDLIRNLDVMKFVIIILHHEGKTAQFFTAINQIMTNYFGNESLYYLDVISSTDCDPDVAKMLFPSTKKFDHSVCICHHELRAAAEYVKWGHPTGLSLLLNRELNGTDEVHLQRLLFEVKSRLTGELEMNLSYSHHHYKEIREEILMELKDAKCTITSFRGCVTSEKVLKMLMLHSQISLNLSTTSVNYHNFHVLEGIHSSMKITVKYTESCPSQGSRPIPLNSTYQPPKLHLTDVPSDGLQNTLKIINFISPNNKFNELLLLRCGLSTKDLNELLQQIRSKGVGCFDLINLAQWRIECLITSICHGCFRRHHTDTPPCNNIAITSTCHGCLRRHHTDTPPCYKIAINAPLSPTVSCQYYPMFSSSRDFD